MEDQQKQSQRIVLKTPQKNILGLTIVDRFETAKLCRLNWDEQFRLEKGGNMLICNFCTSFEKKFDKKLCTKIPISLSQCYLHNQAYDQEDYHIEGRKVFLNNKLIQRQNRLQENSFIVDDDQELDEEIYESEQELISIHTSTQEQSMSRIISETSQVPSLNENSNSSSLQINYKINNQSQCKDNEFLLNQTEQSNSIYGCVICNQKGDLYHSVICKHRACLICWKKWLQKNESCPFCRGAVDINDLQRD